MTTNRIHAVALVLVLLAAPALAGCLGTAQATAMEEQSTAEDRAQDWSAEAELAGITGIEGQWHGDHDAGYWSRASDDPDVGDGHCELWVYEFISSEHPDTVFQVVVDRDGEIVATDEETRDDERAVGEWNVDSDEAAEIALSENEDLEEGTSKDNYGLVLDLEREDGDDHARWTVAGGGGDSSGGAGGVVVIDAVTGDVLGSYGGSGSGDYGDYGGWGGR